MTKYQGLGGLKSRNVFFRVTESRWSKAVIRVGSPEASWWLVDGIFFFLSLPGSSSAHVRLCPHLLSWRGHIYWTYPTHVLQPGYLCQMQSHFEILGVKIWHLDLGTQLSPSPHHSLPAAQQVYWRPLPQASALIQATTPRGPWECLMPVLLLIVSVH